MPPRRSPPSRAAWIEISSPAFWRREQAGSPPSRAAWIEIKAMQETDKGRISRRLHGRRGLKFPCVRNKPLAASRRLHGRRGLKFLRYGTANKRTDRRRLHGRRGLKYLIRARNAGVNGRRLHGRRGLKYQVLPARNRRLGSPPSRAAWIEIMIAHRGGREDSVAAFTGGVD